MKRVVTLSVCLTAFLSLGLSGWQELQAQTKYWVRFSNKTGTPYSISNPSAFLTSKSILRRSDYQIPIDETDLPVNPSYVSQVDGVANVTVLYVSKWMNGLVVSITNTTAINTINSFPFVASSSVVNKYKLDMTVITAEPFNPMNKTTAVSTSSTYYGGAYWQNKQIGVDCLHSQGFRGQGITIAVLDAGFNSVDINPVFDSLRNRGGILGTRDFVTGGNSVYEDDSHGAAVLSCMAAIKPNVIYGSAPLSDYWLLRTEDVATEKIVEEYNWIRGAEFADSVGADILTTSLGYTTFDNPAQNHTYASLNGKTAPMSIAATMAARKGLFVVNAAGNEGQSPWQFIGVPADADSICTVGAIDSLYVVAAFSSKGPTSDGRIKPDVVARGANAWISFPPNGNCGYNSGTSFAAPIMAGAAACFWQAHKDYNNIGVLTVIKSTGSNAFTPNNSKGWGVPNVCAVFAGIVPRNSDLFNFNVMPNPFNSFVKISLPQQNYSSINVQVFNTLGATVKTIDLPVNNYNTDCDLSELTAGIYFIKITTSHGSAAKKVIKQ